MLDHRQAPEGAVALALAPVTRAFAQEKSAGTCKKANNGATDTATPANLMKAPANLMKASALAGN